MAFAKAGKARIKHDFWIERSGDRRGYPTRTFAKRHIGVRVTNLKRLDSGYLRYLIEHIANDGYWSTFPETLTPDHIQSFLGQTFAGQDNFETENSQSNHDLNETIRRLDEYEKDYFLVFAHVEAENGLWGGFGGSTIKNLGESELFRDRCLRGDGPF